MQFVSSSIVNGRFSPRQFFKSTLFTILGASVLGVFATSPVHAMVIENTQCILGQPNSPNGLNCTSNDITLSSPTVTVVKPCNYPGDTAQLQIIVDVTNTAQTRYDIGVWLSVDGDPNGDGSETGVCSVLTIPLTDNLGDNILNQDGDWVNIDLDNCGDVESTAVGPPDILGVDMGTVDLLCVDTDGDGQINVPLIIAWDNQAGGVCSVATDSVPGTAAKCSANADLNLDVPIPAAIIVNKDTIPDDSTLFDFAITGPVPGDIPTGGFDGSETFQLADNGSYNTGTIPGGLPAGSGYSIVETAADGWVEFSAVCSSNIDGTNTDPSNLTLRPGETVTCDYVNVLATGNLTVRKLSVGGTGTFDFGVIGGDAVSVANRLDTSVSNPADWVLELGVGTYDIIEAIPAGWVLTGATCDDGQGTEDLAAGTLTGIDVAPGANIVCTFTNAATGSVSFTKQSVGGDETFSFNTNVNAVGDFDIQTNGGSGTAAALTTVVAGTYQVVELPLPAGWEFVSATCVDGNQNPVDTATAVPFGVEFTQAEGQTTSCTFINKKLGEIRIIKQTDPGGNVTDVFTFDNDENLLPATFDLMDTQMQTIIDVAVAADGVTTFPYLILEQDPNPAFDLTAVTCESSLGELANSSSGDVPTRSANINIVAGEIVTCTFVNTERASITVVKQISGDPGLLTTAFNFTTGFDGGFVLDPVNGPASMEFANLDPTAGPFSLGETNPYDEGWSLIAATCNTADEAVNLSNGMITNIILQAGDDVTCTFINAPLGSASIVKITNPVNMVDIFGFTGSLEPFNNAGAGFDIDTSVNNTADFTNMLLPDVSYDVQEATVPDLWSLVEVVCEDPTGNSFPLAADLPTDPALGVLIDADSNETVTCTFTNEADAVFNVNKVTVPASDDTTTFAFTGDVDRPILAGGATSQVTGPQGSYAADETPTAGWALTDIACEGVPVEDITIGDTDASMVLEPGEIGTCTFTNTKLGSITIRKATVGDVGAFTFTGSDVDHDAGIITSPFVLSTDIIDADPDFITFSGLLPGQYLFSETVPTGWTIDGTLGDIVCTGQNSSGVTPGTNSLDVALMDGEDLDCTFTNTRLTAQITLQKEWVGGVMDDTAALDVTGTSGSDTATSTANGGNEIDTVNVAVLVERTGETITLSEVLGGIGDYATGFSCVNAANQPIALNDTTATLLIDASDTDITCTFTNTINTAQVTLQKAWVGGVTDDTAQIDVSGVLGNPTATSTATGGNETDTTNTAVLTSLVGETVTFSETLGGVGLYNASFNCIGAVNSATYTAGDTSATLVIDQADTNVTCTFTNSVQVSGVTLQKSWVGAVAGDTALLSISGDEGPIQATSTAIGGDQTDLTNVALQPDALAGQIITMTETLGGTGVYTTGFSCAGSANTPSYTPGDTSATLLIDEGDTSITCTFTNTISTARVELQKAWVDGVANDTAALNIAGANGPAMATSVATGGDQTDTNNTAVLTALVGETITLSELLGGMGEYSADFSCSSTNDPVYTPGATSATLLIDATDVGITCMFSNTVKTAEVTLQKAWVGAVANDTAALTANGMNGPVMATSIAVGGDETDTTNTAVLTALVGETITLSEVLGGVGDYTTGFSCTGTNAPTYTAGAFSATLLIDAKDSAITCTYTNTRVDPIINLAKVVNGPATLEADGTYTVLYTITATNSGGPGSYDLIDAFTPGAGITLNTAVAVYQAGTEDSQTGTTGAYPNFVTDEGLGDGLNESWIVTATFAVDLALVTAESADCDTTNAGAENTGFNNGVTGSDSDTDLTDNMACTELELSTITVMKAIDGGDALPADFILTLTAADGVNDSGVDYASGDSILAKAGVTYILSEAADQVADYFENGIVCLDDSDQSDVGHPVMLAEGQSATCTLTNTLNEVVIESLAEVCINNAPLVGYNVNTTAGDATSVDITWIKNDGSDEVVETLLGASISGEMLWPGAAIVDGVAVAWPGWSCDANGENCTQVDDGLTPTMQIRFDINPTETVIVDYPPATSGCSPVQASPMIGVPVNNPVALLLLTLMLLASGWYFRPATMRRF